ncbi:MAG: DNA primase [Halothiobacillaceae bacterium]
MARIPERFIEEVLARTDIVEVIGQRVPLKKKGHEFAACCPFHEEKTPSFYVSPAKQFYHCFGCGAHGNALGFLLEHDRMDFRDAVVELAGRLGMSIPEEDGPDPHEQLRPLWAVLERAANFYRKQLERHPPAQRYLEARGVNPDTAEQFMIGWAPPGNRLTAAIADDPQGRRQALDAGLLGERDDGQTYDRFRDRLMFPIRDRRGRFIGFGGRLLGPGEPKYLNSPETPVFQKRRNIYGLHESWRHDARPPRLVIVEGYMDVIMMAQAGIHNVVATLGTATTEAQIAQLYRNTANLVFCFDGDRAGRKAALRALEATLPQLESGRDLRVLFLPEGEDPDSFVRGHGHDGMQRLLDEQALSLDQFLWQVVRERHPGNDTPSQARRHEDLLELVRKIPRDSPTRMLLERRLREAFGMARRHSPGRPPPPIRQKQPPPRKVADSLDLVCAIWLRHPELAERHVPDPALADSREAGFLEPLRNFCAQGQSQDAWRQITDPDRLERVRSLRIPGLEDPEQAEAMLRDALNRALARTLDRQRRAELFQRLRQHGTPAPTRGDPNGEA